MNALAVSREPVAGSRKCGYLEAGKVGAASRLPIPGFRLPIRKEHL